MAQPVRYQVGSLPPASLDWQQLVPLLGPTAAAVARYDATLTLIPNAAILLSPLTTQEAVLSSRIEGTQATFSEIMAYDAQGSTSASEERRADIHDVLNYRRALVESVKLLETLPLCQRVIVTAHGILLEGVRGHGKAPGELRRIPNWIGPPGCSEAEARFVPIGADQLPAAMSDWEKYANGEAPDRLVQLALLHAEFEAMHPFLDGNGRLGRMLVPLFMWQAQLIHAPMFYVSAYLEAHREEYYERLMAVSRDDDWTGWCLFFLKALHAQAELNHGKAREILALYDRMKLRLQELVRSRYAIHTLDWLFLRPAFKGSAFTNEAGIPATTAKRIVAQLLESGIIAPLSQGRGQNASSFAFPDLLAIAEGYAP